MRNKFTIILLLISLSLLVSCNNDDDTHPSDDANGILTGFTTCKSEKNFYATDSIENNQSCVEYSFENDILFLKHVNAGFNCCPGILSADFIIDNSIITISESEEAPLCNCNCLYDLEMEISGLISGIYTIKFVEPYWSDSVGSINFVINLNDSLSGSYCVARNNYPWGI